jgi:hypothetical protein
MGGDGSHACIWGLLFNEKDIMPILAGTVAFYVSCFVVYGFIFAGAFARALCVDKGVKTTDAFKHRFGMGLCSLGTVLAGAGKSAAILAFVNVLGPKADSLCMYMQAACMVLAIVMTVSHNMFWEQRPFALIFITVVTEIVGLALASYAMWAATHNVN